MDNSIISYRKKGGQFVASVSGAVSPAVIKSYFSSSDHLMAYGWIRHHWWHLSEAAEVVLCLKSPSGKGLKYFVVSTECE